MNSYYQYFSKDSARLKSRHIKTQKNSYFSNYKGVSRRFILYGLQVLTFFLVFTVAFSVNLITTQVSLQGSLTRLDQINFASDLKFRVNLILSELFDISTNRNSTIYIRNNLVSVDLQTQIQKLKDLASQVPNMLKGEDSQYDPVIQEILFSNYCSYLDKEPSYLKLSCEMTQSGKRSGLIQGLTDLELFINDFVAQSNRAVDTGTLVTRDFAMRGVFIAVLQILDETFNQKLDYDVSSNNWANIFITIALIIISIGFQITVLSKVGECDNTFKTALGIFPPKLILSNFMLKSFLIKTSRGIFDSFKEEI